MSSCWNCCGRVSETSRQCPRSGEGNLGEIMIRVNGGDLPVFVAIPEQRGPWPGVVVLHDVGGMKEDLRNQARWLAQEGFLAAAPNLYFRGAMMKCVFAI